MDPLPSGVLYTVIGSLCATIAYLFRLVMSHHSESVKEFRDERSEWRVRLDGIEHALNRTAKVELMRFCASEHISPDIRASAKAMLEEIQPAPK